MKSITKYFFEGLVLLAPLGVTLYLLYFIFRLIDGFFNFGIPGTGIFLSVLIVILTGFAASNLFLRGAVGIIDNIFGRIPFVKLIYNSLKDLVQAFVGEKKNFRRPVLVSIGKESEVEIIGFVTEENLELLGEKDKTAVYIPQSYNFAGNLIIVPSQRVKPIDAGIKEIMTFIVSGGLSRSI